MARSSYKGVITYITFFIKPNKKKILKYLVKYTFLYNNYLVIMFVSADDKINY